MIIGIVFLILLIVGFIKAPIPTIIIFLILLFLGRNKNDKKEDTNNESIDNATSAIPNADISSSSDNEQRTLSDSEQKVSENEVLTQVINEKEKYKLRGYKFNVEGLSWLDYEEEMEEALNEICGNTYEIIDITPKYFIVEALEESGLDGDGYTNRTEAYRNPYANYKFIDKLFEFIPKLNDAILSAKDYEVAPKVKTCYIENGSNFELGELKKKNMLILNQHLLRERHLHTLINIFSERKYLYIGDIVCKKNIEENDYGDFVQYYITHEFGTTGALYLKGFDNNLYLLYEINGKNKTLYNSICYFKNLDQENELLKKNEFIKLKYNIIIDNKTYNVYREKLKYSGGLDFYSEEDYDDYKEEIYYRSKLGYIGYGELRAQDDLKYKGEFMNGEYNGFGILKREVKYKEVTIYEGHFYKGKYDGTGTLYDENGKKVYTGNWNHGVRQGIGTEYNPEGNIIYMGNWEYDRYNGFGTLFDDNNNIKYSGEWYEGKTQEEFDKYIEYNELMSEVSELC